MATSSEKPNSVNVNLETDPVKLFIRDIQALEPVEGMKFVHSFRGMTFKNICIHGVVTEVYSNDPSAISLEVTDQTGCVDIFYNYSKFKKGSQQDVNDITRGLERFKASSNVDYEVLQTFEWMASEIKDNFNLQDFNLGDYVLIVGDVFTNDITEKKCLSAFECSKTSVAMDLFWMQELVDIYAESYLQKR